MRQLVGLCTLLGLLLASAIGAAQAQTGYPSRPITMVVPLPAGGTADLLCRFAADKASGVLGQQVVVENRPGGAGGRVGNRAGAARAARRLHVAVRSAAHLQHHPSRLRQGGVRHPRHGADQRARDLSADPDRKPDLAANSLQDLLAYARANPGKINYGHQGKGNTGHLLGELLMLKGNFRMTEIPYRGSAPAINDLLAGNIDLVPDYLLANKANIDAGKLKFLATGARTRPKDYPNVATIAETLPGVYADTWMAVAAPPGTPKEITTKDFGRDQAGIADARHARAHPGARSRAARQHARPDARHHPAKPGDLGPGGRGRQDHRRMIEAVRGPE